MTDTIADRIAVILGLVAENDRIKAAGVSRTDPSTWGKVKTKTIAEIRQEAGIK